MAFNESQVTTDVTTISSRVRWFAVVTGCLTGIAGSFGLGLGFALIPSILVVGAVIQPRFPRLGRGLICMGALWLSFWVFDIGLLTLLEHRAVGHLGTADLIISGSVVLVALCDLTILMEEIKFRRRVK